MALRLGMNRIVGHFYIRFPHKEILPFIALPMVPDLLLSLAGYPVSERIENSVSIQYDIRSILDTKIGVAYPDPDSYHSGIHS